MGEGGGSGSGGRGGGGQTSPPLKLPRAVAPPARPCGCVEIGAVRVCRRGDHLWATLPSTYAGGFPFPPGSCQTTLRRWLLVRASDRGLEASLICPSVNFCNT